MKLVENLRNMRNREERRRFVLKFNTRKLVQTKFAQTENFTGLEMCCFI